MLQTKVGNFIQPTTTNATFGVTGVGFTPKVIILFATDQTATGTGTNWNQYMGMATATTNRAAISSTQNTATNNGDRAHDDTKCFIVVNAGGTSLVAADLVSFDVDGFTLNFSVVDAVARIVGYMTLGGADLTNAFIKEFIGSAANTAQGFTGVGFKPDAVIMMSGGVGTAPPSNEVSGNFPMLGFTNLTNQSVSYATPHLSTESYQAAKIIAKTSNSGALTMAATMTSFDSDGFTVTYSVSSSQKYCFALCLKGGQYAQGVFNQATTTGNQSVSGLSFTPTGILLASVNAATNAGVITTQSRLSLGLASSSSSRFSIWSGGGNGGIQDSNTDTAKVLNMLTEGASPATTTSADFVSLDATGFTLNNTAVDATAREISYLAIGSTTATTTNVNDLLMMFR